MPVVDRKRALEAKPTNGPGMWTTLEQGGPPGRHGRGHVASISAESDIGTHVEGIDDDVDDDVRTLASEETLPMDRDEAEEGGI